MAITTISFSEWLKNRDESLAKSIVNEAIPNWAKTAAIVGPTAMAAFSGLAPHSYTSDHEAPPIHGSEHGGGEEEDDELELFGHYIGEKQLNNLAKKFGMSTFFRRRKDLLGLRNRISTTLGQFVKEMGFGLKTVVRNMKDAINIMKKLPQNMREKFSNFVDELAHQGKILAEPWVHGPEGEGAYPEDMFGSEPKDFVPVHNRVSRAANHAKRTNFHHGNINKTRVGDYGSSGRRYTPRQRLG